MCFSEGEEGHGEPKVAARRILSCMFTWCEFAMWWLYVYCVSLRVCCVCCWGAWPAIWSQWGAFDMGCFMLCAYYMPGVHIC